jgi:hypothetical protein
MWIKVDSGIVRHKKTVRLSKILKVRVYSAVGMLVAFWADAMTNSIDGDVSDRSAEEIDEVVGWRGRVSFLSALIEVGFVDLASGPSKNHLTIHDWNGNSGAYFLQTAAGRDRVAKHRAKKKDLELQAIKTDVTVTEALRNGDVTVTEALRNDRCNGAVTPEKRKEKKRKEEEIPPTPFCDEPALSAPASPVPVSPPEGVGGNEAKEPAHASKRPRPVPEVPSEGSIAPEAIKALWNETRPPSLSAISTLEGKRLKTLQNRLKQFPAIEEWRTAIRNLSSSPFHCGEGFRADFDWLLSEKGIRCFEGPLGSSAPKPTRARVPTGSTYGAAPIPLSMLPPVERVDFEAARAEAAQMENTMPKRRKI